MIGPETEVWFHSHPEGRECDNRCVRMPTASEQEKQRQEWEAFENSQLAKNQCPHSGDKLVVRKYDDGPPDPTAKRPTALTTPSSRRTDHAELPIR